MTETPQPGPKSVDRRIAWLLAISVAAVTAAWGIHDGVDGWPDLASHLRDDAYYEFTWACNLVRGTGPVVSDGTTTSGVQYLWSLLLAWLTGGQPDEIADVAVLAGAGCHLAAALTFVIAARGRPGGICVALLWLGNPLLLRECQNGQETSLTCLCAVLLWHGRRAPELLFAVLAALAVFARSDLFAMAMLLSMLRHGRHVLRGLVVPVLLLAAMVAVNLQLGGGPLQDSALPMAWLAHASFLAAEPGAWDLLRQQWWFLRPALLGAPYELAQSTGVGLLVFLVVRPWWPRMLRLLPSLAVLVAFALGTRDLLVPAIAALLIAVLPASHPRRMRLELLVLLVGLGAIVVLHWGVRWYPRDYYAAPLVVGGAAALLVVHRLPLLLLLASAMQMHAIGFAEPIGLRHQLTMDLAGRFLPDVLQGAVSPGERIGCFNSGIVGFRQLQRGGDLSVLNLDGVVDHRAFSALQEGRLAEWLDEQGVRLLLDNPVQFATDPSLPHACGRWFGSDFDPARDLSELARFVTLDRSLQPVDAGRPGTEDFRLYWRNGSAAPPTLLPTTRVLGREPNGSVVVQWAAAKDHELLVETTRGGHDLLLRSATVAQVVVLVPADRLGSGRLMQRLPSGEIEMLVELR